MQKFLTTLLAGLCAVLFSSLATHAQTNSATSLPATHAETLSGTSLTLPVPSSQTLLFVGFSRASGDAVTAWFQQAQPICDAHPHLACYKVAVLEEAPSFIRGVIIRGMQKKTAPAVQQRFAIVVENESQWKQAIHYSNADDAYAVLLDSTGAIVWQSSGEKSAVHLDGLQVKLQR